jgi:hypothetical protein
MKSFVSTYWIGLVSLVACVAAFSAILAPQGFALRGLAWVTLGLAAVMLSVAVVARRSPRALGQVVDDVDQEPALVPVRAPRPTSNRKNRGTP